jgi:gamma-glutamylcyclotransferase (GGCT)/AIG2-like uncharacterized protein YtfP
MTNVFTYGSLMFPQVWTLVVAGSYRSIAATVDEHARFAVAEQDYPGMVARAGGRTTGVLYLDVGDEDVARLDHFEGEHYRRVTVPLVDADGVERTGDTYLYLPAEHLLESAWDPDAFALERFVATYCREKLGNPAGE